MSELAEYVATSLPSGELEADFLFRSDFRSLRSLVVIPVAAHQESVERIVDTYQQSEIPNTGLYLYLNVPVGAADERTTRRNTRYLEVAPQDNDFLLGGGLRVYDWGDSDGPFSMGKIRRDGWLHILSPGLAGGLSKEVTGFSHDADILSVSKNLFQASQAASDEHPAHLQYVTPYWGLSHTETNGQNLPALNRLSAYLTISEEAFRLSTRIHRMWDWAVGFRLESYGLSEGYQASSGHSETGSIIEGLKNKTDPEPLPLFTRLDGEFVITSMRRFVMRAAKDESPFDIMDPSIGTSDDLRDKALPVRLAEAKTRANLIDWCRRADERNITTIIDKFSEKDGQNIDMRIGLYQDLANHGRLLLRRYGQGLDGPAVRALPVIRDIALGIAQKQREILNN